MSPAGWLPRNRDQLRGCPMLRWVWDYYYFYLLIRPIHFYYSVIYCSSSVQHNLKQAFIEIRVRPSRTRNWRLVADQASHATPHHPLRPNMMLSIKPEVHNILQLRQRRTELQRQGRRTQNFVRIVPALPYICSRTDRQKHWSQQSTPQPGQSNYNSKKHIGCKCYHLAYFRLLTIEQWNNDEKVPF